MMLIIVDGDTQNSVDWLVENTSKSFVFKQTLELAQLICSSGLSDVYKKLNQAKELRDWVKNNSFWVQNYFYRLIKWCESNVNLSEKTAKDWWQIRHDILSSIDEGLDKPIFPATAIWRYSKNYESEYPTNSELEFNLVCNLYKAYLKDFKFKKKTNMSKPIIIDGLDVSNCKYINKECPNDFSNCGHICEGTECKYKRLYYKKQYKQLKQEYSTVCYSRDKFYNDLLEVVEPYLSDFTGYDEKEQAFNIVLAVKELLEQLKEEKVALQKSQYCVAYEKDCHLKCKQQNCAIKNYLEINYNTDR